MVDVGMLAAAAALMSQALGISYDEAFRTITLKEAALYLMGVQNGNAESAAKAESSGD